MKYEVQEKKRLERTFYQVYRIYEDNNSRTVIAEYMSEGVASRVAEVLNDSQSSEI